MDNKNFYIDMKNKTIKLISNSQVQLLKSCSALPDTIIYLDKDSIDMLKHTSQLLEYTLCIGTKDENINLSKIDISHLLEIQSLYKHLNLEQNYAYLLEQIFIKNRYHYLIVRDVTDILIAFNNYHIHVLLEMDIKPLRNIVSEITKC